ncbi:MAG: transposase family protein [Spirochaetaceae bacterium]|nr:transposase family protein [Spirochaetaceae bacterium]
MPIITAPRGGGADPTANKLYPLYEVIVITIPALIALARGREDTGRYAKAKKAWPVRFLKPEHGVPHHDVYRRVISRIVPEEIERCFMNWVLAVKREYGREGGPGTLQGRGKAPRIVSAVAADYKVRPCRFAGNRVFPFSTGAEGPDRDTAFQGIRGPGEAFPLYPGRIPVFFEVPVYGRGAYRFELFRYVPGDMKGRPSVRRRTSGAGGLRKIRFRHTCTGNGPDRSGGGDGLRFFRCLLIRACTLPGYRLFFFHG